MFLNNAKHINIQKLRFLDLKGVSRIFLSGFFVLLAIFFSSDSLRAQIENIYDSSNDDVAGINALMSATASNDVNGVRFFSKAGRALINQKNFGGATALHLACREGYFEIAKILIDAGADVNIADNEGWTPLMRAALAANSQIVELLISRDVQAGAVNSVGESAIVHAATSNCNDCLNIMFEKYNFIRAMDIKLLKDQLTDAFIIARNRENEVAQGLLAAYLDQVIKMSPLIEKEKKEAQQNLQKSPDKIFKITSEDDVVVATRPVISVPKPQVQTLQEQSKKVFVAPQQQQTTKIAPQKIYKFSGEKKSAAPKAAPQKIEQGEEIIIPIRKLDDEPSLTKPTSKGVVTFKFEGKKQQISEQKTKFIPKIKAKPQVKISAPKPVTIIEKQPEKIVKKVEVVKKIEEKPATKIEAKIPANDAPTKPAIAAAIERTEIISPPTQPERQPEIQQPERQDSSKIKVTPKFIIGVLPNSAATSPADK